MRFPRPTYANVMSTIAVFIALGGTSYAVASLPKNSVGDKQLKANAVTGEKVKDGSLTSSDLSAGAIASGPRGPRGAEGRTGDTGATGPSDAWATPGLEFGLLSTVANQATTVARISNLPPGQYVFHGTVSIVAHNVPEATTYCHIVANTEVHGTSVGIFGKSAGATRAGAMSPMGAATMKDVFQLVLECWNSSSIPAEIVPGFQQVGLDAIRVGTLH